MYFKGGGEFMEFMFAHDLIDYIVSEFSFIDRFRWKNEKTLELFDIGEMLNYLLSIQDCVDYFYLYENTLTVEIHYFTFGTFWLYCF